MMIVEDCGLIGRNAQMKMKEKIKERENEKYVVKKVLV